MSRYSQLLALRRSKRLLFSTKRPVESSVLYHHSPTPQPPSIPTSNFLSLSTKKWSISSTLASHYHRHHHQFYSTLSTAQATEFLPEPQTGQFEVTIKSKEIVTASVASQPHWLPMSNLDLLLPPLDAGVLFCYKKKNNTTAMKKKEMVNVVKRSLSQVLSFFYPFAGELVQNGDGEPEILCNNNGVDFVHAYADIDLTDLDLHRPDDSIKGKLVPDKKRGVLSVQVTEMNCGGIVVGCTFDHRVADAYSTNMFLVAWAEAAQSKPISQIPSFRRSILNPRRPTQYDPTIHNFFIPISSIPPPPPPSDDELQSRIYSIRAKHIDHLQSQATSNGTKRSKLQSFTAFLWKIIAEGSDDVSKACKMGLVVDGRKGLNGDNDQKIMQNYFGNVLSIPYGEANVSELKEMPLNRVGDMVHGFLADSTTGAHFRGLIDWVELHRPEPAVAKIYIQSKETDGEAVVVSSGQRFAVGDIDFGWGKPEFGSFHFAWGGQTGYVMPMTSTSKNGDWIVYMHLLQKHLDLIETKAGHVFTPLTTSYLNL